MKKNDNFRGGITKTVEVPEEIKNRSPCDVIFDRRPFPKLERPEDDLAIRHVPLSNNDESVKNISARYNVEVEFSDGSSAGYLNIDEETKNRLASQGVVTPIEDPWAYSSRIQKGDFVRLPDGRFGTVRMIEERVGRYDRVVSVDVDGAPRRWFGLRVPLPMRFADGEINYLKFVATKEEMDAIQAEADE